jgi:hypothetical protein
VITGMPLQRPTLGECMESPARRLVVGSLIGLALALLLVGLVSGTVLRHIVQIVPIMVVLAVVRRRPDWGASAVIPIFVFWISSSS